MIYCVWYPSGGFGHFVGAVLNLFGKNFVRPTDHTVTFGADGNSHGLQQVVPKYKDILDYHHVDFDPACNYSVLVDNGITSTSEKFRTVFPKSTVIKICYTDRSWPIVARTMIEKAMQSSLDQALPLDGGSWHDDQDWAKREKYFLFLRDNFLKNLWPAQDNCCNVFVEDFLNYQNFCSVFQKHGIEIESFETVWNQWHRANQCYLNPVYMAQQVIHCVKNNINTPMTDITDLWSQAVVYYYLWLEFQKEVPHNDYKDFFTDTHSVRKWLSL